MKFKKDLLVLYSHKISRLILSTAAFWQEYVPLCCSLLPSLFCSGWNYNKEKESHMCSLQNSSSVITVIHRKCHKECTSGFFSDM